MISRCSSEPRILQRTLQCCALNGGVFLLSIFAFNGLILPLIETLLRIGFGFGGQLRAATWVWSWTSPVLSATFSALWILPLFVLSKFVNCLWFQVAFPSVTRRNFLSFFFFDYFRTLRMLRINTQGAALNFCRASANLLPICCLAWLFRRSSWFRCVLFRY